MSDTDFERLDRPVPRWAPLIVIAGVVTFVLNVWLAVVRLRLWRTRTVRQRSDL